MLIELLEILRCPKTGQKLIIKNAESVDQQIHLGVLESEDGKNQYLIRNFIPRFVPEKNYADNFGMQWNLFSKTQLDSNSGCPISFDRFWKATGWSPEKMKGQWVLDAGCGSGRFAEVALNAGAKVVALDYSSAVDACYENLKHHQNLFVVQGDIYALPFQKGSFSFVYSLGVLQHTPYVTKSFEALPPMVISGGKLCVDVYWKRFRTMLHSKYLVRPFSKYIPQQKLFNILQKLVPILLPISQILGRIPIFGKILKRIVPVADYTGIFPLNKNQLKEWALLDTFDMLGPTYDNPQSVKTVEQWFKNAQFENIEVFHGGHLVGRGNKP